MYSQTRYAYYIFKKRTDCYRLQNVCVDTNEGLRFSKLRKPCHRTLYSSHLTLWTDTIYIFLSRHKKSLHFLVNNSNTNYTFIFDFASRFHTKLRVYFLTSVFNFYIFLRFWFIVNEVPMCLFMC